MELCYHCFQNREGSGACPHCGYDPTEAEKKYPLALKPGSILNGRYIVGRVLGQGGFGITYIAQDDKTKDRVAIKEYLPAEFAGREPGSNVVQPFSEDRRDNFDFGKEKFLEEAKTLAAFIGDEHIVRIYNYFEENGTAYFTMEYVEGRPLDKYIKGHNGSLTAEETNDLLLPLMEALEKVHAKGIVHRDIAPDNIIVQPNGVAKLIDFGAARYSTGEQSKSLDVVIKHGFAPYEQYTRRGRQGPFTDVYAMAATYYYAITGKVLPDAVDRMEEDTLIPPSSLGKQINGATENTLIKALEVLAPHRYQNMGEFRLALTEADPGYAARSATKEPKPVSAPVTRKKKTGLIALACGLALVALAALFLLPRRAKPEVVIPAAPLETEAPTASPLPTEKPIATAVPAAEEQKPSAIPEPEGPTRPLFTEDRKTIVFTTNNILAAFADGKAKALFSDPRNEFISQWDSIIAVEAWSHYCAGLRSDGRVFLAESVSGGAVSNSLDWENIISISAGEQHLLGLKADGSVISYGNNPNGQCDVTGWKDITAISAGKFHSVGLHSDGTVTAVGGNHAGQCDVSDWTNIVAISAGTNHTVGLCSDGTVIAAGNNASGQCDLGDWTDIVAISAGYQHTFGLRSDGTVVVAGRNQTVDKDYVSGWTDVVYFAVRKTFYDDCVIGIRSDGTVLKSGSDIFKRKLSLEDLTGVSIPYR